MNRFQRLLCEVNLLATVILQNSKFFVARRVSTWNSGNRVDTGHLQALDSQLAKRRDKLYISIFFLSIQSIQILIHKKVDCQTALSPRFSRG